MPVSSAPTFSPPAFNITLGAAGTVLVSAGPASAPSFQTVNLPANNANNGQTQFFIPQSTTGLNAQMARGVVEYGSVEFTGNYRNNNVINFGYNSTVAGIYEPTVDPFSQIFQFESNYEHSLDSGNATAGTTDTTLNDSGKAWPVNGFTGWTLYNVTRGDSERITSNTATSITTASIPGQVSGDAYQLFRCDSEEYVSISVYSGGTTRNLRPIQLSFDRSTSIDKIPTMTINAASAANPMVLTVSAGHRIVSTPYTTAAYVKLSGMPGSYGVTNGLMYPVTIINSTQFSVPVNSSGFGAYAGGGSAQIQPSMLGAQHFIGATNGFEVLLAAWGSTSDDRILWVRPGLLDLYTAHGTAQSPTIQLNTRVGVSSSAINFTSGSFVQTVATGRNGVWDISTRDTAGANQRVAMSIWRGAAGGGTTGALQVGLNAIGTAPTGLLSALNTDANGNAANPLFFGQMNASQSGDPIRISTSGAAKRFFLDASGNLVPLSNVTTAAADTNGFLYAPLVSATQTGVPANLTGDYASCAPFRFENNGGVYSIIAYINGGWRRATLV